MRISQEVELNRLVIHAFPGRGEAPEIAEREESPTQGLRRFIEDHIRGCVGTPSRRAAKFNGPDTTVAACASAIIQQPEDFVEQCKVMGLWFAHQSGQPSAPPTFLAIALFTDLDDDGRYLALLKLDPTTAFIRSDSKIEAISILPEPSRTLPKYAIVRPHDDESRYDVIFRNTHDAAASERGEADFWLEGFLEAYEVTTPRQMTQLVVKETEKWIQANEGQVEDEVAANLRNAVRTMAQGDELDLEEIAVQAIKDPVQREEYIGRLLDRGLTETAFEPDREWAQSWSKRTTYVCDDGVRISGPSDAIDHVVQILPKTPDRKTRLVIETKKFIQK